MVKSVAVFSKFPTLVEKLSELLPEIKFIKIDAASDLSPLKEAEIIIGDCPLMAPHLYNLPKARWVQATSAGIDALLAHIKKEAPPQFPYTRLSGENFGPLMSEYVFTQIVNRERQYFKVKENQIKKIWDRGYVPVSYRGIADLKIGVLGIGAIGNRIGKTLNYLGATIYGFGRRETIPLEDKEYQHIAAYFNKTTLPQLLASVDYFVNILPKNDHTNNILGNGLLKNCQGKNVIFINIGRGNVIKEVELVHALKENWISGAILDVFETEPLPQESLLWEFSNVVITPHISGNSREQDIAAKFKKNLERFENNEPLIDQIDYVQGY